MKYIIMSTIREKLKWNEKLHWKYYNKVIYWNVEMELKQNVWQYLDIIDDDLRITAIICWKK